MRIKIAPSMVASDLAHLADSAAAVIEAGAELVHVDVADGHFVPNIMLGPQLAAALARVCTVPVGVHLMLTDPLRYAPSFVGGSVDTVFFHVEAVSDLPGAIESVHGLGVRAGVVLKPATPAEAAGEAVGAADCLMAMTVEPGFGGQSFMEEPCRKIPALREMFGSDIDIYVDGGIDERTLPVAARYGASVMVAGTSVFGTDAPPGEALRRLRRVAEDACDRSGG